MKNDQKLFLVSAGNLACLGCLIFVFGGALYALPFCFIGPEADVTSDRVNPAEVAWQVLFCTHLLSVSFFGLIVGRKINAIAGLMAGTLLPGFLAMLFATSFSGTDEGPIWGALVLLVVWYFPLFLAWARGRFLARLNDLASTPTS